MRIDALSGMFSPNVFQLISIRNSRYDVCLKQYIFSNRISKVNYNNTTLQAGRFQIESFVIVTECISN